MLKVGVDIMGGDYAPQVVFDGCKQALPVLDSSTILQIIGPSDQSQRFINSLEPSLQTRVEPIHSSQFIEMGESAVKALQQKPDSSILVGLKNVASKNSQTFASAGHSGALMVAAMQTLGTVKGIDRPAAVSAFPQDYKTPHLLLDVGINIDAKTSQFYQFALLGTIYSKLLFNINNPRVGLLNAGTEAGKGNSQYREAFEGLKKMKQINFIGNIEARDFYKGVCDVSVCDGFTGNIFLKQAEGMYQLLKAKGIDHPYLENFNYESYGGTPILGLKGNVVLAHGASNATAIKNMILTAENIASVKLASTIEQSTVNL